MDKRIIVTPSADGIWYDVALVKLMRVSNEHGISYNIEVIESGSVRDTEMIGYIRYLSERI